MDKTLQNPADPVGEAFNFVGEVVVNGVSLPLHLIEQLRMAGVSAVNWLSASELQDAVQAAKFDTRLVDDPHGTSLRDKMTLTHAEQASRRPKRRKAQTYEELIKEEREGKAHEMEDDHLHFF
ncbi:MAG: hypothetical protein SFX19_09060 [Alphaproteobacteria bacterium]|nr:hypothetical protein [Alphaproteobacteria bacterium]